MSRRLKALSVLHRLAGQRLEDEARSLTALRGRVAALQAEKASLRRRAALEGGVHSVEAAPYIRRFLESVRLEITRIDAEILRLERAAQVQESTVRACFIEEKAAGAASVRAVSGRRAEQAKAERRALDEIALFGAARQVSVGLGSGS